MRWMTFLSKFARAALALALAGALAPSLAFAADGALPEEGAIDKLAASSKASFERFKRTGNVADLRDVDAYEAACAPVSAPAQRRAGGAGPATFDLRDRGVVTPAKLQNPWGTCWGFGVIAAAETSIMSELGMTVAKDGALDLSELHLAWFSYTPLPADDADPQAGEGTHSTNPDPNAILNEGGHPFTATSVFSSGIGPMLESLVPYRNKEGLVDETGNAPCYAKSGDWSVDEALRFAQLVELEETRVLPSPAQRDEGGAYRYNPAGTQAIKDELEAGRAVEVCFSADTSKPGEYERANYINLDTWAHYTYDNAGANHAVTIVGWDDNYATTNFREGFRPEGPGAWIVKNSWGALENEFPHKNPVGWGVGGTGYFYLSYYDKSLSTIESLDFYTDNLDDQAEHYLIDQHDFMPSQGTTRISNDVPSSMANVFTAQTNQNVRSLSCETAAPDTTVTYELYLLDEGFAGPTDGKLAATRTEFYPYGGYHRVHLDEGCVVEEGQSYAVVVTQTVGEPGRQTYQVLMDRAINKAGMEYVNEHFGSGLTMYAKGVVNRGESFLREDGVWKDWVDGIAAIEAKGDPEDVGYYDYDNFPIKAYADPLPAPSPATTTVPDLANLTEAEALAALAQAGLEGRAGEARHSDEVEAGRVLEQGVAAGAEVEKGSPVTYVLSLGARRAPIAQETVDIADGGKPLASTGDPADSAVIAAVLLAACAGVIAGSRIAKRSRR